MLVKEEEPLRMLRMRGELWFEPGQADLGARCGMADGRATSNVPKGTVPAEEGQTGFGNDVYSEWYMVIVSYEAPYTLEGYAFHFQGGECLRGFYRLSEERRAYRVQN